MIDPVLVTRKINLILADLKPASPYGELTPEAYLSDPLNEVVVERYLERIIGRIIDINYHMVTESGNPPPKDYFESFLAMGRLGVLPVDFSRSMARTAGLRNRLVHEYNELDPGKVYEALKEALQDIPRYIEQVQHYLDTHLTGGIDQRREGED